MIVARDFLKIAADGGRIGSPAAEARRRRGRRAAAASAGKHEDIGRVDVAVVGDGSTDTDRPTGAKGRRPS